MTVPDDAYEYDVDTDHLTYAPASYTVRMQKDGVTGTATVIGDLDDHRMVFLGATGDPALLPGWTISDSGEGGGGPEGDGE